MVNDIERVRDILKQHDIHWYLRSEDNLDEIVRGPIWDEQFFNDDFINMYFGRRNYNFDSFITFYDNIMESGDIFYKLQRRLSLSKSLMNSDEIECVKIKLCNSVVIYWIEMCLNMVTVWDNITMYELFYQYKMYCCKTRFYHDILLLESSCDWISTEFEKVDSHNEAVNYLDFNLIESLYITIITVIYRLYDRDSSLCCVGIFRDWLAYTRTHNAIDFEYDNSKHFYISPTASFCEDELVIDGFLNEFKQLSKDFKRISRERNKQIAHNDFDYAEFSVKQFRQNIGFYSKYIDFAKRLFLFIYPDMKELYYDGLNNLHKCIDK